tara:strand:- start:2204 stop:3355 length:1152 start_codon:yes stop_codon:yes gene_type:complete
MSSSISSLKKHFQLDPKFTYLNHGSFGACPYPIFNERKKWQKKLEFQPVSFIQDHAIESLEKSREALSSYIHCDKDDVVYFPNPTTAMNMVIRSLDLKAGDEVLSSNHEYGAVERTWKFVASQKGFSYKSINIPIPFDREDFLNRLKDGINSKTKIIFLSHITSPTAIIFPIDEVCKLAKELGIMTIIDGAHAPAQIDLNLNRLGADIYTGACHKWMLCPKGVAFLYASKAYQNILEPLVVSWGWESDTPSHSQFLDYHQYQGTNDISAYLTVPKAISFLNQHNWEEVRGYCHEQIIETRNILIQTLGAEPICSDADLGQMTSLKINVDDADQLYRFLKTNNIEVPIFSWNGQNLLRVSFQCYNSMKDISSLNKFLSKFLNGN